MLNSVQRGAALPASDATPAPPLVAPPGRRPLQGVRPLAAAAHPESRLRPLPHRVGRGRLHGSNVIDAYTEPDGKGGVDLYWNVSTWNPYGVLLVRTNLRP